MIGSVRNITLDHMPVLSMMVMFVVVRKREERRKAGYVIMVPEL